MKSTFFISTVAVVLGSFLLPSTTNAIVIDPCTLSLGGLLSDPGLNSSASITLVENTVKQSCVNTTDPSTSELVAGAASLYAPAKEGLCQHVSTTNGTFCATVLTQSMTVYLAQHPSPLGLGIFANSTVLQQYVNAMPQDLLCTPCNKAMINPLTNFIAENQNTLNANVLKWANVIESGVQAKCGADFTNGAAPNTTASPQTGSNAKSAGLLAHDSSVATVVMVVFLSAVALIF
ncbi:hypothetical protein BGX26_000921 [Mortierella sp. AD094]|nr:hypothetical protein BGX26_000921 [Mortierella sp. AD094]